MSDGLGHMRRIELTGYCPLAVSTACSISGRADAPDRILTQKSDAIADEVEPQLRSMQSQASL